MKWFIFDRETVQGPYSAQEVKNLLSNVPSKTAMVWSQVLPNWTPGDQWLSKSDDMIRESKLNKEGGGWHYALNGQTHGPLSKKDLVKVMSNLNNVKGVLLWTKGFPDWVSIFQVHEVLEEVGLNRREHPRAAITGAVKFLMIGRETTAPLVMISQGGFGVDNGQFLSIGQEVTVEITSPSLGSIIRATATVRYVSRTGYAGFKFLKIHPEAKSKIIDYVRSQIPLITQQQAA